MSSIALSSYISLMIALGSRLFLCPFLLICPLVVSRFFLRLEGYLDLWGNVMGRKTKLTSRARNIASCEWCRKYREQKNDNNRGLGVSGCVPHLP